MQGALGLLFEGLLGLGGWLVQGGQGPPQAAGAHLYVLLFSASHACKQCQQYRQVTTEIICINPLRFCTAQACRQSHYRWVTLHDNPVTAISAKACANLRDYMVICSLCRLTYMFSKTNSAKPCHAEFCTAYQLLAYIE